VFHVKQTFIMPYIYTILFTISSLFIHDYHFGLTEIHFNKENKSIETAIKLFTDDLEKGIKETYNIKARLNTKREIENSDDYINKYIEENTLFTINEKEYPYTYLGKEYEEEAIWIYIEVKKVRKIKSFSFKNTLLFDTFEDQKHILNVNINGKTKSKTLEKGYPTYKAAL